MHLADKLGGKWTVVMSSIVQSGVQHWCLWGKQMDQSQEGLICREGQLAVDGKDDRSPSRTYIVDIDCIQGSIKSSFISICEESILFA